LTDIEPSTPTAAPELAPKVRTDWGRYGRRPLNILFLIALVDAVDRGILPGVLTTVQDDLGFSDTQAGYLGSIFILTARRCRSGCGCPCRAWRWPSSSVASSPSQ